MSALIKFDRKLVLTASKRLKSLVKETPIITSRFFDNILGCNVYFKCENFQTVEQHTTTNTTQVTPTLQCT